jgi:hypothetical protein
MKMACDRTAAPLDAAPSEHQIQPRDTEGMRLSEQIAAVLRMTQSELLDYVIAHPHYLADVFYKDLAAAIKRRRAELALLPSSRRRSRS